jgi:hypothetical protein
MVGERTYILVDGSSNHHSSRVDDASVEQKRSEDDIVPVDPILVEQSLKDGGFAALINVLRRAVKESDVIVVIQNLDRPLDVIRHQLIVRV